MEKPHIAALRRAIRIAGSQKALADGIRACGKPTISQQTISYWLKNGVLLDPEWWVPIEQTTDLQVTRRDLRPDVFGDGKAA